MKNLLILLLITYLTACNPQKEHKGVNNITTNNRNQAIDCNVALKFINEYTAFCANESSTKADSSWIERNQFLTNNFKKSYKNIVDSARQLDPELGLDFDPIFDAQDYPEKGFELANCDTSTGYVTVTGKEWTDFKLVLKVVKQGQKWLVNGAGVINIPTEKREKR